MTSQEDSASPQTIEECRQLIEQLEGQASLSSDSRSRLAKTYSTLGEIFGKRGTPDALREAVASYDEAIAHGLKLPLEVDRYRSLLANAYNTRGNAHGCIGTPDALREAVASCDEAIAHGLKLPLEVDEYRNDLANAYNTRGIALWAIGTPDALREAVASYDEAIAHGLKLPLEVDEYRHALARAYNNRAFPLRAIGTPDALREAVGSCDEAIAHGLELQLEVDEYRSLLAKAYNSLGNAHSNIGTPDALKEAVASYDEAIAHGLELQLEVDEYRNDLANAYNNRGIALKAIGTPDALREAVASYDEAIAHHLKLLLEVDQYRNDLARAYNNRGNALRAMGAPYALREAVASYDEAIAHGLKLPLEVGEYRYGLASAYLNRAFALRAIGTPDALREALAFCDEAIRLLQEINESICEAVNLKALALWGKTRVCLDIGTAEYLETAADAADEGLNLVRDLEMVERNYLLRPLRESLFRIAIEAYLATSYHFVPELILEHLDPENPGAAPESVSMHEDALEGLQRLFEKAHDDADLVGEIYTTAAKLAGIRDHYFIGTATGARFHAEYWERAGDQQRAETVLAHYVQLRPSDPEGHQLLGSFYVRRGRTREAIQVFERAAAIIATNTPADSGVGVLQERLQNIFEILDLTADLVFGAWPPHNGKRERDQVIDQMNAVNKRLNQFVLGLPSHLSRLAESPMDGIIERFSEAQKAWHDLQENKLLEEWQREAEGRIRQKTGALLNAFGQGLRLAWGQFTEAVEALMELITNTWEQRGQDWEGADNGERAEIESEIAEIVSRKVSEFSSQLFSSELANIVVLVKEELGPLWEILSSEEQKHLAIGFRSMDDQHLHRFAGLSMGLAVETSLSECLFERLRSHLQDEQAREIPIDDSEDYLEPIVTRFLNRQSDHLMLGQMVGSFNRVVHFKAPSPRPVDRLLTDYLSGLPGTKLLFVRDESVRSLRRRALNRINDIRVRCAHPKNLPDKADLDWLWKHVVSDPDHAFFRYFRGAFLHDPNHPGRPNGRHPW